MVTLCPSAGLSVELTTLVHLVSDTVLLRDFIMVGWAPVGLVVKCMRQLHSAETWSSSTQITPDNTGIKALINGRR